MTTHEPKLAKEYALSNAEEHERKKTTKAQQLSFPRIRRGRLLRPKDEQWKLL